MLDEVPAAGMVRYNAVALPGTVRRHEAQHSIEREKMPDNDSVIIQPDAERRFCEEAFGTTPMPAGDAETIADTLVESDLRGVYSHGIQILPRYIRGLRNGINPTPRIETVVDAGSLALLDGDCGMGHVVSTKAMQMAIDKAGEHGIAAVGVRNSNHQGALAYYGMMAASQDMIGICTTNAPPVMAPWGGVTETLGNNPICYAIPAGKGYPVLLDMAVSTVARNKIRVAAARGQKMPPSWGLDRAGQPTDDPQKALDGLIAPMAEAKGFGLGVVFETLTAVLSGGLLAKEVSTAVISSTDTLYPTRVSHYFQAIDVSRLVPIDQFKARVDQLAEYVHESELAKGVDAVYMPGEIEFLTKEKRLKEGIPVYSAVLSTLDRLAEEVDIERLPR